MLNSDVALSTSIVVNDDLCDDDALVNVLPLDGAALSSSSCVAAADILSVSTNGHLQQLRRLVSPDDLLLLTDRLLPAADRSADVTLSTSVLGR